MIQRFLTHIQKFLMKTLFSRIFLCFLFFESLTGYTQTMAIGDWRLAVPYTSARVLADGKDFVYTSSNVFFYGFHKTANYPQIYDKLSDLSDVGVSYVAYDKAKDIIVVAYENSNVDLIKGNTTINISDIRRANITGKKTINAVYLYGNTAYLSCGFGIVVLDLEREEIRSTYFIGTDGNQTEVFACAIAHNYLYAATAIGVQRVSLSAANPANFQLWEMQSQGIPVKEAIGVESFNDEIFAIISDTLYKSSGSDWVVAYADSADSLTRIRHSGNYFLLCTQSATGAQVLEYSGNSFQPLITKADGLSTIVDALITGDNQVYVADLNTGLYRFQNGQREQLNPNSLISGSIARVLPFKGDVWVVNGTIADIFFPPVLSKFSSNWWGYSDEYSHPILQNFRSLYDIAAAPSGGKLYVASYFNGIVEFDINNNSITDTFTIYNSTLEFTVGDPRCKIGGIAFDNRGNLWATSYGATNFLSVRKTDGTWKSFRPVQTPSASLVTRILVDDFGQKWMLCTQSISDGIVVFSEGSDMDSPADNKAKILRRGTGVGNLPSNEVISFAKDRNGEIWVGTSEGIAVFYCPGSVLTDNGCEAQEILVTAPDGFVGTLLGSERVQAIAVDGANRKWVGTTNGLWLFSPDGTRQIHYFNFDNSPLISNNIIELAVDPESGNVFIGTDKGLVIYRSDATEAEEEPKKEDVLVYPNPVRPGYSGNIAIKGLTRDADVRITDVSGNLVFKTTALGGQAIWDGKINGGDLARAGVYLVFTTGAEGENRLVSKVLVMR